MPLGPRRPLSSSFTKLRHGTTLVRDKGAKIVQTTRAVIRQTAHNNNVFTMRPLRCPDYHPWTVGRGWVSSDDPSSDNKPNTTGTTFYRARSRSTNDNDDKDNCCCCCGGCRPSFSVAADGVVAVAALTRVTSTKRPMDCYCLMGVAQATIGTGVRNS